MCIDGKKWWKNSKFWIFFAVNQLNILLLLLAAKSWIQKLFITEFSVFIHLTLMCRLFQIYVIDSADKKRFEETGLVSMMHSSHIYMKILSDETDENDLNVIPLISIKSLDHQSPDCDCVWAGAVRADRRGESKRCSGAHLCQQAGSGHGVTGQWDRRRTQPAHVPGPWVADSGLLSCVWGGSSGLTECHLWFITFSSDRS